MQNSPLVPIVPERYFEGIGTPHGNMPAESLFALIKERVARHGSDPAFVAQEGSWTLCEAWQRALALAGRLHKAMAGEPCPVVVFAEKNLTQAAAFLACLRLGVPWIPITPGTTDLRTRHVLGQAAPFVLVHDAALPTPESGELAEAILAHDPFGAITPPGVLPPPPDPTATVVVAFTSGSTGVPKGVPVSLGSIVRQCRYAHDYMGLRPDDRQFHLGNMRFSLVQQMLQPFLGDGATILMPVEATASDCIAAMLGDRCTQLGGWAGFLGLLARHPGGREAFAHVRSVNVFSDGLTWKEVADLRALLPDDAVLGYSYGLTETYHILLDHLGPTQPDGKLHMGLPVRGVELWFEGEPERDADGALTGPLAVTLAPGQKDYWRTGQNADRFLPHPCDPDLSVLCTRDIVRQAPEGRFWFVGRADNQIKMHGHRIEIEEIEAVARQVGGVEIAGVVPQRSAGGDIERLVLHVASKGDVIANARSLEHHMAQALPQPMRPASIIVSSALPMTTSGK
ncbi:MAG: AMP-binding protein, partial [Rhodospirillaceae bacterium]|nr:AMP-binding protein [Rhodospirillaceae bacterium]